MVEHWQIHTSAYWILGGGPQTKISKMQCDDENSRPWITVKRKRVDSGNETIPLANRFSLLDSDDNNTSAVNKRKSEQSDETVVEHAPPAFYIDGVNNISGMINEFIGIAGKDSFKYKCVGENRIKINALDVKNYKT